MFYEDKIEGHDLNIGAILKAMEDADIVEDFDGNPKKSLYLGTVFSLTPSGKYYMPWACSNLDPCHVCGGKGEIDNPYHLPKLYARANDLVQDIIEKWLHVGIYREWPKEIRDKVDWLRDVCDRTKSDLTCPRCDGLGCAEARDDEVWMESLEEDLSDYGMYLESGEGDPCDLFVCMPVEEEVEIQERCCG